MSNKKAYVIGTNVSTSLSPMIFKYWFEKHNILGEYEYIEIKENNFHKEIKKILKEDNLCGLNITIPFKEKIIPHLTKINGHAKKIMAVNCVTKKKDLVVGKNTDWLGFYNALSDFEKKPKQKKVKIKKNIAIVLGYGGSGKAVVYALNHMGFKTIKVFNRTFEKIKNINKENNLWLPTHKTTTLPYMIKDLSKHTPTANLIVNTIPINIMEKNKHKNKKITTKNTIGVDIIYKPKNGTGFLNSFFSPNRMRGLNMLVYQAAPCFKEWFGIEPDIDSDLFNFLYKNGKI